MLCAGFNNVQVPLQNQCLLFMQQVNNKDYSNYVNVIAKSASLLK